jgi:uncharacterized membrane protein (DUF2068 family)
MAFNILLMIVLIVGGDYQDLNNWLEIGLWAASIAGLLSMRKWGAAFATFTLCYTLSISAGILIYYQVWPNAVRVVVNAAVIVYMFRSIFAHKFK